jgi:very-short-patch-repair endonuclease
LVKAAKLFSEEREEVLEARTVGMLADGSERMIAVAGQKAMMLAGRESSLNEQLDVPRARREFSSETLYKAADALAASNVITALSSEVRQANSVWRGLVRNPTKANAHTRSGHLREAAGLLAEAKEFAEDPKHKAVLGPDFEGHHSDFDLYRAAAGLLRSAALTMARSSAPFRSATYQKLLEESTQNLRLLRARFSSNDLASLEQRLSACASEDEELNKLVERGRVRHSALTAALDIARRLVTKEAGLPMNRAFDGEWHLTQDLLEWKRRESELRGRTDLRNALGPAYDAILANPAVLRAALATAQAIENAGLPEAMIGEIKASANPSRYRQTAMHAAPQLAAILETFRDKWGHFAAIARLSEASFLGDAGARHAVSLQALRSRFSRAAQSTESLLDWMRYRHALDDAISAPPEQIAGAFDVLETMEARLADIFELCLVRTLIRHQLGAEGRELAELTGTTLDDARARFAALDKELLDLEAKRLVAKTALRLAPYGNDQGPRSSWSERALLENEAKKRKRHIPLRDLIRRAPNALRSLKPVWMMSPLTAAQYLPRLEGFFDIVIIDEASQMKPADAIGGLARASQAIIVGDPMQLPPTDFFGTSTEGADGQDGVAAGQSSILDLAEARLRQTRMLRWHYRSRHESLIAFSNKHFYEDRLVVFPSATDSSEGLGIEHVYVGGQYLGGGTNIEEARVIVDRARELIERNPDLSIGLVTTNTYQRELVLEELEKLAHENRKVADYRARWQETLEPLFVKNLENVQGDERDIILISTVFGPGETGQVAQRFGPINSEAGHRRLNVLFTRAKRKIVLVTSLRSGDIVAAPTANRGVHVLKSFLEYASVGRIAPGKETGQSPDSDFEVHVANRLRQTGYEAVPQVGVDGFRIDIGVRHPGWPNGFLAGIECDGATYHSGVTVRDRDRLRQEILEGLGWRLYRVWSTDWFTNQDREMAKMLAWLEELRTAGENQRHGGAAA